MSFDRENRPEKSLCFHFDCASQKMKTCVCLCFLIWVGGLIAQAQGQMTDIALADRFRREVPARWEEYTRLTRQLQGSFSAHLSQTLNNIKVQTRYDVKINGESKLVNVFNERTIQGKTDYRNFEVLGTNSDYAFTLVRKGSTSPWLISKVINLRRSNKLPLQFEQAFDDQIAVSKVLVTLFRESLADLLRKPEFRVLGCRMVADGDNELVEVVFGCPHEVKSDNNPIQGGKMILDPQHYWCLRSYEIRNSSPDFRGTRQFKVLELGETGQSLPVPKHAVAEYEFDFEDGSHNKQELRFEYNMNIPPKLPDKGEFKLSAFGLPEPAWLARPPRRRYVWVALAGLICLALAAMFRWLARRAKAKMTH